MHSPDHTFGWLWFLSKPEPMWLLHPCVSFPGPPVPCGKPPPNPDECGAQGSRGLTGTDPGGWLHLLTGWGPWTDHPSGHAQCTVQAHFLCRTQRGPGGTCRPLLIPSYWTPCSLSGSSGARLRGNGRLGAATVRCLWECDLRVSPEPHACSWSRLVRGAVPPAPARGPASQVLLLPAVTAQPVDSGPSGQTGSCCAPSTLQYLELHGLQPHPAEEAGGGGQWGAAPSPSPSPRSLRPARRGCPLAERTAGGAAQLAVSGPGLEWPLSSPRVWIPDAVPGPVPGNARVEHLLPLNVRGYESVTSSFRP